MTPSPTARGDGQPPEVDEMMSAIFAMLGGAGIPAVGHWSVRPSPYRTSSALFEVDVTPGRGEVLGLLLKSLGRDDLHPAARHVKPRSLHEPAREPAIYREFLQAEGLGTPRYFGEWVDPDGRRRWLLLERVAGVPLYEIGDFEIWREAARWLARLHARSLGKARLLAGRVPLLRYDASFYLTWFDRARSFHAGRADSSTFDRLGRAARVAIDRLEALPSTIVHGEYYASNVLVRDGLPSRRICPVDWETAGIGPGLVDLAALTSGRWSDDERLGMVEAYRDALPVDGGIRPPASRLMADLDACRFLLSVQWLGWSPDWDPPAVQARDWLGEAILLADAITGA